MPLPETEANVEVMQLLKAEWDDTNLEYAFNPAWISTGWADEDSRHPEVTLSGVTEDTSPDGIAPGKGLAAWVDGVIDCNVWVPYDRDTYTSAGEPKQFRWQLIRECHRIIENNQTGVGVLSRLDTGDIARDPVEPPPPYRGLLPIRFSYRTSPE